MNEPSPSPKVFLQDKDKHFQTQIKRVALHPDFSDLNDPQTFINHVRNELPAKAARAREIQENKFPVSVFPEPIQKIITATNESLKFPIDFMGASILYAVSVSIGNTFRVEVMKGWPENAVLYLAIVGRTGTNKSHPLSFALKPIEKKDSAQYRAYQQEKKQYEAIINLSKKEREQEDEPIKPTWKQHLVTDFTPEALADVHKFNDRGIGVYSDELASWFKNFNRYNKGSEEQFWLSVWSGKAIRVNRKTTDPTYIPLPFISVAGTIQPQVLNELAKDRTENGFIDRLLFVMPDNLKKEYWSNTELDPVIIENWETVIDRLLEIPLFQDENHDPEPRTLQFTPEAKKLLFEWQKEVTDKSNEAENEAIRGIYAKIEMYAVRLSLILEMIRYTCGESNAQTVGIESVQGAIKLAEYFKNTAVKVHEYINKQPEKKELATMLSKDGKSFGEISKIIYGDENHKSTVYRWITGKK